MTLPMQRCSVEGCTRPSRSKTGDGLCGACYQGFHYWMRKRSVRKMIARAEQLHVLSARMTILMGRKKVVRITTKRKKRRAA